MEVDKQIIKVHNKIDNRTIFSSNEIIEYEDYAEIILYDKYCKEKSRAKIDREDVELIKQFKWYDSKGYATTSINSDKVPLHRYLMKVFDSKILCDHKNRDSLDNRRNNLRLTNHKGNNENIGIRITNTSGVTGVRWNKRKNKWRARIRFNNKELSLGYYDSFEDAVKARLEGEIKYYGEFAPQAYDYIN